MASDIFSVERFVDTLRRIQKKQQKKASSGNFSPFLNLEISPFSDDFHSFCVNIFQEQTTQKPTPKTRPNLDVRTKLFLIPRARKGVEKPWVLSPSVLRNC